MSTTRTAVLGKTCISKHLMSITHTRAAALVDKLVDKELRFNSAKVTRLVTLKMGIHSRTFQKTFHGTFHEKGAARADYPRCYPRKQHCPHECGIKESGIQTGIQESPMPTHSAASEHSKAGISAIQTTIGLFAPCSSFILDYCHVLAIHDKLKV
jgi:hypothetical protein